MPHESDPGGRTGRHGRLEGLTVCARSPGRGKGTGRPVTNLAGDTVGPGRCAGGHLPARGPRVANQGRRPARVRSGQTVGT
jgi:hypothetical protein